MWSAVQFAHSPISHVRTLRSPSALIKLAQSQLGAGPGCQETGDPHCTLAEPTPPPWALLVCHLWNGYKVGVLRVGDAMEVTQTLSWPLAGGGHRQREGDQPALHPALPPKRWLHPPPAARGGPCTPEEVNRMGRKQSRLRDVLLLFLQPSPRIPSASVRAGPAPPLTALQWLGRWGLRSQESQP